MLSINKLPLNVNKTQAITFLKNEGNEVQLSDTIIERSSCVKFLGISFGKHRNFSCHSA